VEDISVGVQQPTISNYLTGNVIPKKLTLKAIADHLNIYENWLKTGEGDKYIFEPLPESDRHGYLNRKIKEIKTLASKDLRYVLEDEELKELEIYVISIFKECEQVLDYIKHKLKDG